MKLPAKDKEEYDDEPEEVVGIEHGKVRVTRHGSIVVVKDDTKRKRKSEDTEKEPETLEKTKTGLQPTKRAKKVKDSKVEISVSTDDEDEISEVKKSSKEVKTVKKTKKSDTIEKIVKKTKGDKARKKTNISS